MSDESSIDPGTLVAKRYQVERLLGVGGVGEVYRALDKRLNRAVAIKFLLPSWVARKEFRLRFLREARVASALRHPNAIQVFDFGKHEEVPYMVTELLSGEELFNELDGAAMPLPRALRVAHCVADVLVAAHRVPLVHRDLKPENIFLDTSAGKERVVVLDFGLAFLADSDDRYSGRLTRQGEIGGTPAYMAPEQASGEKVGPPADVYALGCVLFEMLTGRPPFDGSIAEILAAHLYTPAPALQNLRTGLPTGLVELVERMMDKRISRRPTMEAVRHRLSELGGLALGARERSRDAGFLQTREARMVEKPHVSAEARTEVAMRSSAVQAVAEAAADVVIGCPDTLGRELQLGLSANGMRVVSLGQVGEETLSAVFAASLEPGAVADLSRFDVPVVTSCAPSDMDRIAALLRAGVAEVVPEPVAPALLAKRLWRVIRKHKVRSRRKNT